MLLVEPASALSSFCFTVLQDVTVNRAKITAGIIFFMYLLLHLNILSIQSGFDFYCQIVATMYPAVNLPWFALFVVVQILPANEFNMLDSFILFLRRSELLDR